MSMFLIRATVAVLLLGTSAGPLLAQEAMDTIMSIDAVAGTVTLENGQTFAVPKANATEPLNVGDWVMIQHLVDERSGLMVVLDVNVAKRM